MQPIGNGEGEVQCLAFSHDGTTLLAGVNDEGILQLWDVVSNKVLPPTFFKHYGWVKNVAFSSDDQKVAIVGTSSVSVWDVKNEEELISLSDPDTDLSAYYQNLGVSALCFSPNNQSIALGFDNGIVKIWDILSNKIVVDLPGHQQRVKQVIFSFDGTKLVTGSTDGIVQVWDGLSYTLLMTLKSDTEGVSSMCISPDAQRVAIGKDNGVVSVWWMKSTILQKEIKMHTSKVTSMSFSSDGHLLITCDQDGQVCFWAPGQPNANHPLGVYVTTYPVGAIHWQDKKQIILADMEGPYFYHLVLDGVLGEKNVDSSYSRVNQRSSLFFTSFSHLQIKK